MIEYNANSPIYLQVIEDIKKRIIAGEMLLGQKLPSTRELALKYEINPNTAARVYTEMESMGLCFTRRGLGTFLTEDSDYIKRISEESINTLVRAFITDMKLHGFSLEATISKLEGEWKDVSL